MNNVIVAGSRDFNNFDLLVEKCDKILGQLNNVQIVSGTARGADKLGEKYAELRNLPVLRMAADWVKYGRSAGYRRNEDMAKVSQYLVAFWNGHSKGTKHMIDLAKKHNLKIRVIKY